MGATAAAKAQERWGMAEPALTVGRVATMAVGATVEAGAVRIVRMARELWEFRVPGQPGCVMVGRGQAGEGEFGASAFQVVEYGDQPPVTLDEAKTIDAALSVAMVTMAL